MQLEHIDYPVIKVNDLTPVALFAYSRPGHLKKSLASLQLDPLAHKTPLYIFCDAPGDEEVKLDCDEVKRIAHSIQGFSNVKIIERPYNYGLAKSIIEGVSYILNKYDQVIILEDDLVVSPHFLKYMNEALNIYKNEPRVAAIHGYLLPLNASIPETFFLKGADCWGWATWSRAWRKFNPNGFELLNELKLRNLTSEFDLGGVCPYTKMLANQVAGLNQSWAIRWQASVFLNEMLTLYPCRSLVQNIGNDNSGIHCSASNDYDVHLTETPIRVLRIPVEESLIALSAVKNFYKKIRWLPRRIMKYIANHYLKLTKISQGH